MLSRKLLTGHFFCRCVNPEEAQSKTARFGALTVL